MVDEQPTPVAGDAESRLRALTDFAKAVGSARWSEDVLLGVAEEARRALDADHLSLSRWERGSGWLRTLVNVGELGPYEEQRPSTEIYPVSVYPLALRLLESGSPFLASIPAGADPRDSEESLLQELGKGSGLGLPVHVDGQVRGEMFATRRTDRPAFVPADLDFGQAVAVQVAAGIAQAEHLAKVEALAYADPLTGLANRRVLDDRLDVAMGRHAAEGIPVTLVVADLNDLKGINDRRGHDAGDAVLRAFADVLSQVTGDLPGAIAARLGGDEFAILAPDLPADRVVEAAERLCAQARRSLPAGTSCGVASTEDLPEPGLTGAGLFRIADAAQYRAKRTGLREPVVAGRSIGLVDEPTVRLERRAFRGRSLTVEGVLSAVARALDECERTDPASRLYAASEAVAVLGDVCSWFVSRVAAGDDRFRTVGSDVSRLPETYLSDFNAFFDDADGYAVSDFPASQRACEGRAVVVAADDPEADPAEVAILAAGGFVEMVMAGGQDASGDRWLVELFADELSVPVTDYALALRAGVAMALAGGSAVTVLPDADVAGGSKRPGEPEPVSG